MREVELTVPAAEASHQTWVLTRLRLDQELIESVRYGFSLIAAGFGSFAVFEGLTIGERQVAVLPRTFALIVTVIGIIVVLLSASHARKMTAWVNTDEFGTGPTPKLPDENRPLFLATAAVIIGGVSFAALLLLPS